MSEVSEVSEVSGEVNKNNAEKREREYYERAYTDFLRFKIPKIDKFISFVHEEFSKEGYHIIDCMSQLTKDTKCCILNYLNLFEICKLSMTCSAYAEVVSEKYNDYWKSRYRKVFPTLYVTGYGFFSFRNHKQSIIWFDAYQYSAILWKIESLSYDRRKILLGGRQTFHTFVKWKRVSKFPAKFKTNITHGAYETKIAICEDFLIDVDPQFLELLGGDKSVTKITIATLANLLYHYALIHFKRYTTEDDLQKLRKLQTIYDYNWSNEKECFLNFPEDFLKKWGLNLKTFSGGGQCYCRIPYYSGNSQCCTLVKSLDEFYDRCSRDKMMYSCVKQRLNGPIIESLHKEFEKYGIMDKSCWI